VKYKREEILHETRHQAEDAVSGEEHEGTLTEGRDPEPGHSPSPAKSRTMKLEELQRPSSLRAKSSSLNNLSASGGKYTIHANWNPLEKFCS